MTIDERKDKLKTLPWQALYDLAVKKEVDETEINGKDKETIINRLLSTDLVSDGEIETLVNDYIYGNRVTFTLWSFRNPLNSSVGATQGLLVERKEYAISCRHQ